MKVGTDGTLLGAWARGGRTILDIGTGTGLIALMMAQRHPEAQVTAVDIDENATLQARENVEVSPFDGRIEVVQADIRRMAEKTNTKTFDAIVANPPYFNDSLTSPDKQRTIARHTSMLTYRELMAATCKLLADDGLMSVVVPSDCRERMTSEALLAGLFLHRECEVRTVPTKAPRRYLLEFGRHNSGLQLESGVIESSPGVRSTWYSELTNDFYL